MDSQEKPLESVTLRFGVAASDIPAATDDGPGHGVVDVTTSTDSVRKFETPLSVRDLNKKILGVLGIKEQNVRKLVLTLEAGKIPSIVIERYLKKKDIDAMGAE